MKKRPNILLIMADNHPANLLGCYGNDEIHTPNIDQFASQGTRFTQAYCVNAMCSPCRASVLTGLMPSQHGIHTWIDDRNMQAWPPNWNALAKVDTLPEILKSTGYRTALIGKYHLGDPSLPQNGFDHWVTFPHGHTRNFWGNTVIDNDDTYVYEDHIVDFFTEKAVNYLNAQSADSEQPFFLFLPYNGPYGHWPSIQEPPRNRFAHLYADCPMHSIPREGLSWPAIEKYLLRQHKSGGGLDYSSPLRIPNDMQSLRNYFSQMSMVDDGVGQVLTALDENELAEDTLVIYTCDHGFSLGQHGFWGHGQATWPANTHAAAFHIPLLIRQPRDLQQATPAAVNSPAIVENLVSQVDLFPTLLDAADVSSPAGSSGLGQATTLAPLLASSQTSNPDTDLHRIDQHRIDQHRIDQHRIDQHRIDQHRIAEREAIFMEQEETRSIRTGRWLYMQRFDGNQERPLQNALFDLNADPEERTNVAGTAEFAQVELELQQTLRDFFQQNVEPQYDLWTGGIAKSNSDKPWFWKEIWGEEWRPALD